MSGRGQIVSGVRLGMVVHGGVAGGGGSGVCESWSWGWGGDRRTFWLLGG